MNKEINKLLEEVAKKETASLRQLLCKNSDLSIVVNQEQKFEALNIGCNNPRRDGSAWCEECAKKYHETKEASREISK